MEQTKAKSDDDIQMEDVVSSNVKRIGYNLRTRVLRVEFSKGGVYTYHDVPPEKHSALMRAESKGAYLHANIKGAHSHAKAPSPG